LKLSKAEKRKQRAHPDIQTQERIRRTLNGNVLKSAVDLEPLDEVCYDPTQMRKSKFELSN